MYFLDAFDYHFNLKPKSMTTRRHAHAFNH